LFPAMKPEDTLKPSAALDGRDNEFAAEVVADGPIPQSAVTEMTRIR